MPLAHDIGTGLYHTAIRAAAPFLPKARGWLQGRQGLWERLEAKREALRGCLWMHCASTGEFEQGLPVLEAIKAERPELPVLVTFFSPSGHEAFKDFPLATHVEYLPPDSAANARRLVALLRPKAVLWMRYEFWYHHLKALADAAVPTFLVSGIFRPQHPFFRWYGGSWRAMLRYFEHLFVQDEASRVLLAGIGVAHATVSGDTRFDRVAAIVADGGELPIAAGFRGAGPVLVCGSTWPADEALLGEAFRIMGTAPKCLVAPHELREAALRDTEQRFPKPLARWSELEGATRDNIAATLGAEPGGTLLVDRMGLLARLYRYGDMAYVGGGFGQGVHSLLEPAAWGLPVVFGPNHAKFAEAKGLIDAGAGFEVRDAEGLALVLGSLLSDPAVLRKASEAAARYTAERRGATERMMDELLGRF